MPCIYADKSLPTSFPIYARPSSCFFPHDSHTMRISSSFTAKSCAVCSSANLREKSGSVPCEETITATHLAYQALLQQIPVQYARRRVSGKNRDRFRLKKPFCLSCKPTNLNPNLLQQTYAAEASMLQQLQQNVLFSVRGFSGGKNADKSRPTASAKSRYARQNSHLFSCFLPRDSHTMRISSSFTAKSCAVCLSASLPEKSGSVPCEETILFVNVAAIAQKCPVFRAWFQQRKRSGTVPCTATNFVCLVSR